MAKDLAIVLNSGSIDSAVCTALAAQRYRLVMLHVEVPSVAAKKFRTAYDQQVAHFKPYREHTLAMPFLATVQNPGLAASNAIDPRHSPAFATQLHDLLPLIGAAGRFALFYQAAAVYMGLRVGPSADDLAQGTEYIQIWNELLQLPCGRPDVEVLAPLLELEPWQVVDLGVQVGAPLEYTWSCTESAEACWSCRSCRQRDQAFQQAAKPDPMRGKKT